MGSEIRSKMFKCNECLRPVELRFSDFDNTGNNEVMCLIGCGEKAKVKIRKEMESGNDSKRRQN